MKRPGTNTTAVTGRTKPRAVEDRTDTWALNGTTFDPDKAALLQRTLRADPHNLEARVKLLGYLSQRRFGNLKDPNYCEHAVWLIRNYPGIKVSGSPWVAVHRRIDPCFRKIERIWDHHRVHFPRDSAVLRNVARFYSGTGSLRKAEAVLRRLQGLEPHNPDWHGDLARLYYLHGRWQKPAERRYWASKALHEYIRAEAKSSAKQRYYLLPDLAEAAYEARRLAVASRYARNLLARAREHTGTWSYGNAIHHGNTVLGLVAADQGRLAAAERHLAASCRGVDSPQLMSFGPSTRLAEALLAHGSNRAVVGFLEQCKTFWRMDSGSLTRWIDAIEAGRKADFMVRFDVRAATGRKVRL
ncbi:MAG TPA: hypothetical protein VKF40_13040 [Burkholderiales bacterium]|nr:hypothetical protein [Burkholderiales bacterium]